MVYRGEPSGVNGTASTSVEAASEKKPAGEDTKSAVPLVARWHGEPEATLEVRAGLLGSIARGLA